MDTVTEDLIPVSSWWEGPLPEPHVRTGSDLRAVMAKPDCPVDGPLYYMYRNLARSPDDKVWLENHSIRYDITVIPPARLCGEYVKTKGHHHPKNAAGTGYPEIYEVISGEVHYLLQERNLNDVILIEARAGDLVVIPPEYGHVSINPSGTTLVMANLVSTRFSSDYTEYERRRGAVYYEFPDRGFLKNMQYGIFPPIRSIGPAGSGLSGQPILEMIGNEQAVRFLNEPQEFSTEFRKIVKG
jgi:glucose-6-phosphate isomerase